MPKPILLIKLPYHEAITKQELDTLEKITKNKTNDEYHVLVFVVPDPPEPMVVECVNSENTTEKDLEELREYLHKQAENAKG